jgi:hypothetical protein
MSVWLGNPLVFCANFIVPLLVAYLCALKWGPNKGALYGVVPAVTLVFILFVLQVSPGTRPDGTGRLASAFSYMRHESIFWVASFLVGLAIGSVQRKLRGGQE